MPTATFTITSGANDGHRDGAVWLANTTVAIFGFSDTSKDTWLRFTNVTIPQGSTINSATLVLTGVDGSGSLGVLIHAEAADNPAMPTSAADANGRAVTTGVAWNPPAFSTTAEYTTPDIKAALQAVVDRAGFASGNAVNIAIKFSTGSTQRRIFTAENGGFFPRLEVNYSAAAPTYTGTANLMAGAAQGAVSGTFAVPTYGGAVVLTAGTTTAELSGVFAAPVYTGAIPVAMRAAAMELIGDHSPPIYAGTVAASLATISATINGLQTPPTFSGTIALQSAAVTVEIAGTSGSTVYTGTALLGLSPTAATLSGAFTAPAYTGTLSLLVGAAQCSVAGIVPGTIVFATSYPLEQGTDSTIDEVYGTSSGFELLVNDEATDGLLGGAGKFEQLINDEDDE